jgi:peptidoglycan hydrolase CwlO-like protein
MSSGIEAHLRDLENEAREAERDVDDLEDRAGRRIEEMNNEVREHVARVQREKQRFRDQIDRKKHILKKKLEEVAAFRVSSPLFCQSLILTCSILDHFVW